MSYGRIRYCQIEIGYDYFVTLSCQFIIRNNLNISFYAAETECLRR
jgi:hypothetical protein